jgi:AraC-like DNA-binding protein
MHSPPMISCSVTIGLAEAIEDVGANPDQVFSEVDLNSSALSSAEGFLPCVAFARLLDRAAAASGNRAFGVHFGARFNPKNIGALAYAVFNSPTVGAALETAGRYIHLHNEAAQVSLREEANGLNYFQYDLKNLAFEKPHQFVEYGMAVALKTLRLMVGSQWNPREVHFSHEAPTDVSEHREVFRAPVIFACSTTGLVIEREFCSQPIPAADSKLLKVLRPYLDNQLSQVPKEDHRLAPIRRKVADGISDGHPNLRHVAKAMACSSRTLQRQLNNCGIDFRTLVDDTRKRLALKYLKDPNHTLTQIAFLLGYSEVSAFNRSFKRWTGKTPLHYRRRTG